jgi:alkaline phosphatase D
MLAIGLAVLGTPASSFAAGGFTHGVTAGEITSHSAIVWAQTKRPGRVVAQVRLGKRVVVKRRLRASSGRDDTVQAKVGGLEAGRAYRYRFCRGGGSCSLSGRFETAPAASSRRTIRFAYSGDETGVAGPGSHGKPFWGSFKAFRSMAAEHNDFNVDLGDTIYSDPEVPGAKTARSVRAKWRMYRRKLSVPNMRRVRSATGMYNHWDDHEFINDFSIPEDGRRLYDPGVKAFRDYEPVTFSRKKGIYRSFRWGKDLQIFFLDERSFRSAKASANRVCDNPSTNQPDLAPTAPQSTRNLFALLIPSLSQPVSQACKDTIDSPTRTFLGNAQLRRFLHDVKASRARWKVVMNEDPIQQFYGLPYDRWEGYAYERVKLLKALQSANVRRLVFLTTDAHAAFANVVRLRTLAGDVAPSNAPATAPSETPYQDFIIGPVATKPFWQEIDDTTGTSGSGIALSNAFFKPPPPDGVGMACAQGGVNSYAEVTVKHGSLKVAYKDQNGNTVKDSDSTTPCGPYVLTH